MKNYLIGMLAFIIVFLVSVIYRQHKTMVFSHFPVEEPIIDQSSEARLYVFLFFSKKSCSGCLDEIVKILNRLSTPFYAVGVVPDNEWEDEAAIRRITGVTFPLRSFDKFGAYIPWHLPTLICVDPSGKVIFVLPDFALHSRNIENFLTSVYCRLADSLEKEKKE